MNGTDWYQALSPYLVSMEYEDNSDGKKADDLNIELADRDGKFISDWMPDKGAFFDAGIVTDQWFAPGMAGLKLDCGRFWIDTIEFSLPENKVSVKATSIPTDVRIKGSRHSRGWEKTSLQDIANQIAGENKMSLDWQADNNPRYIRTEQHEESPLSFLMKRCNNAKLAIKIHRQKIVIFDEQKLEEQEAKFTLLFGNTSPGMGMTCYRMAGAHFSTKLTDTCKKAKVSHTSVETGETTTGEHTVEAGEVTSPGRGGFISGLGTTSGASTPSGGSSSDDDENDDKSSEDTDGDDEEGGDGNGGNGNGSTRAENAEGLETQSGANDTLKAKSNARDKNKKANQASIDLSIGNPLIAAGQTFNLKGCGQFDGKWFIESAHHTVGPEYNTKLTIRRCLTGY